MSGERRWRDTVYRGCVEQWVYGGALAGVLLLVLLPLVAVRWSEAVVAAYVLLPVYMLHQLEEHAGDRFREFANAMFAGGRDALTHWAVFCVNVFGVWGVLAASVLLAALVRPGLALIGVYGVLVNAVVHVAAAMALRRSNPGVWTAVVLFVPVGVWSLVVVSRAGTSAVDHVLGLGLAVLFHAAIVLQVRVRAARLRSVVHP